MTTPGRRRPFQRNAEIHDDERVDTAMAVQRRAVAWFAERGVTTRRVLSDNGSAYRSYAWREACAELGITPKRTRPYRPQTNGKIQRFYRTLAAGWAFRRLYLSESQRRKALPGWLHEYNHHRPHRVGLATVGRARGPSTRCPASCGPTVRSGVNRAVGGNRRS